MVITQGNAASAEESASASEELNSQAVEMNELVSVLTNIVGSTGTGTASVTHSNMRQSKPLAEHRKAPQGTTSMMQTTKVISTDKVIPLDDDFAEF